MSIGIRRNKKVRELFIGETCEFRSRREDTYDARFTGKVIDKKKELFGIKYLVEYSFIDAGWFDAKVNRKEWVKEKDIRN